MRRRGRRGGRRGIRRVKEGRKRKGRVRSSKVSGKKGRDALFPPHM